MKMYGDFLGHCFRSSGISHCVAGLMVPKFSKEHGAFEM
jgi:hypothetical protein